MPLDVIGKFLQFPIMKAHNPFHAEVEAFLRRFGVQPTVLGRSALNDPNFVADLRKDKRRVWPETAEKVRAFMRKVEAERQAA